MKEPKKKESMIPDKHRANVQFRDARYATTRCPSPTPQRLPHTVSQTPRVRELVAAKQTVHLQPTDTCRWKLRVFKRHFGVLGAYLSCVPKLGTL